MNTQPVLITGGPADFYIKQVVNTDPKRRAPSAIAVAPLNGILAKGALSRYEENTQNKHKPGYV